ncbi:MAG: heparinase II/III family protein [Armatimonadota bacterium]
MRIPAISLLVFCAAAVVLAQPKDIEGAEPRCRKYDVQHPVYPHDHSVWGLVRTQEKAEDWVGLSDEELCSHIDDVGIWSGDNKKMVGVLKVLAQKYGETQEPEYAYKAAVLLDRFREVLPKWGWKERGSGDIFPHDTVLPAWDREMPPRYAGMWSSWHPYDLHQSAPLVLAYDQIYNSGQIEALGEKLGVGDMKLLLERDLLYFNLSIDDRYPLAYGNTEANRMLGKLTWGLALGDPPLVHRAVRYADNLQKISYFPSDFWHEGSPAYHQMITGRWATYGMRPPLDSYSDPPGYTDPVDGTRFDDLDLRSRWRPFLDSAARTMQQYIWPDGRYVNVNDAQWDSNTTDRWDCYGMLDEYQPDESRPALLTWSGHGVLGQGSGEAQVQARLNFGGTYGHDHYDRLHLSLWANNMEILSETHYGSGKIRSWTASTAGHNTVVINEQNQLSRSSAPQRDFTEIDEVAGVEDFDYARRTIKHGTTLTDGQLRLFDTSGPNGLQVMEVDGHRAYPEDVCSLYRRTLCMVKSSGDDVYFVDIFRVRGGQTHDWMLHGPLHRHYTAELSMPLQPMDGTLHEWIGDLKSAEISKGWSATFEVDSGEKLETIVLSPMEGQAILGQAPAMRREGDAPFLDIRSSGPESIFVAVHEPYTDEPKVTGASLVETDDASEMAVGVKVQVAGRTDAIVSTLDADGFIGEGFTGHFGYSSLAPTENRMELYMVDSSHLGTAPVAIEGTPAWTGTVVETMSTARGDAMNAFITDADLPVGEELAGRLILTEDGDGSTRGFVIERIDVGDDGTIVVIDRRPGMTIEDGYVKLKRFPNWGIRGDLTFRVPNSVRGPQ